MANFALEIFDDECTKCIFYTVKWEYEDISETEKFFEKYYNDPEFKEFAEELAVFINKSIGYKYGAIDDFFRWEKKAHALPPKPGIKIDIEEITILADFPLRLYCLRISKSCVILFNGAPKTSDSAQEGETSMAFHEANVFAERILKALSENALKLCPNDRTILNDLDSSEITDILL